MLLAMICLFIFPTSIQFPSSFTFSYRWLITLSLVHSTKSTPAEHLQNINQAYQLWISNGRVSVLNYHYLLSLSDGTTTRRYIQIQFLMHIGLQRNNETRNTICDGEFVDCKACRLIVSYVQSKLFKNVYRTRILNAGCTVLMMDELGV